MKGQQTESSDGNSRLQQRGLTWLNHVQCFCQHLCLVEREHSRYCNQNNNLEKWKGCSNLQGGYPCVDDCGCLWSDVIVGNRRAFIRERGSE